MLPVAAAVLGEEEKAILSEVVDSGWITMGDRVRAFERAFAREHGFADAVAVSSCTAGLHLVMRVLGIGRDDEVLVPSLTFVATVNSILYVGATPVFVDIESLEIPHLSRADAVAKCSEKTRAVVVMHYAGYLVDADHWRAFANSRGLFLVEDAAHAVGAEGVGNLGDAAVFSFFGNKNITTAEGGMIVARNPEFLNKIRQLRSHGMTTTTVQRLQGASAAYDVTTLGYNYRMDELRAAVGSVQLQHQRMERQTCNYDGNDHNLLKESVPQISIPFPQLRSSSNHILPILLPSGCDRRHVMAKMRQARILTSVHYPPVHRFSFYRTSFPAVELPITEEFAGREVTLPLFPTLEERQVERVTMALADALA